MEHEKIVLAKKVILAIDDNAQQLREYKCMLVPGYDLRVVKTASEALNFLNHNTLDIILLDIEMPEISGFEFLTEIKKIPRYTDVPVIIVSGNTGEAFLTQARNSGAAHVLIKPVKSEELITAIETALNYTA